MNKEASDWLWKKPTPRKKKSVNVKTKHVGLVSVHIELFKDGKLACSIGDRQNQAVVSDRPTLARFHLRMHS